MLAVFSINPMNTEHMVASVEQQLGHAVARA
jgi:hypothetical protein